MAASHGRRSRSPKRSAPLSRGRGPPKASASCPEKSMPGSVPCSRASPTASAPALALPCSHSMPTGGSARPSRRPARAGSSTVASKSNLASPRFASNTPLACSRASLALNSISNGQGSAASCSRCSGPPSSCSRYDDRASARPRSDRCSAAFGPVLPDRASKSKPRRVAVRTSWWCTAKRFSPMWPMSTAGRVAPGSRGAVDIQLPRPSAARSSHSTTSSASTRRKRGTTRSTSSRSSPIRASPTDSNTGAVNPSGLRIRRSPTRSTSSRPSVKRSAPAIITGRPKASEACRAATSRQRDASMDAPATKAAITTARGRPNSSAAKTMKRRERLIAANARNTGTRRAHHSFALSASQSSATQARPHAIVPRRSPDPPFDAVRCRMYLRKASGRSRRREPTQRDASSGGCSVRITGSSTAATRPAAKPLL